MNQSGVVGAPGVAPDDQLEQPRSPWPRSALEPVLPRDDVRPGSRAERTPRPRAPPPTRVGAEIVAGYEPESGFPTMPSAAPLLASRAGSSRHARRRSMTGTDAPPRNLAARMGRWSADHWKTATFGWLGFVLVAFALGSAFGTKTLDPNTPGPGESGRMDRILDAGFKRPADESVLIQSRSLSDGRPRPSRRRRGRRRRHREARRRAERPLAARPGQRGPDRTGRPRRARRVRDPRRSKTRRSTRSTRSSTRSPPRSMPIRSSSSASSAMRAPPTRSTPPSARTSARPGCSRSRSR